MIPSKTVGTLPVIHSRRTGYLGAFAAIAFAISWAIEIPLALVAKGVYSWEIPFSIHYLAAFGPGIAGIIMTWEEGGIPGLRGLFIQSVTWRVGIVWWVVAFSPLFVFFLVGLVIVQAQGTPFDIRILDHVDFLPNIGVAVLLVWLATFGFGEEIGWRGYLLPRLQRNRSAWSATFILWTIWAVWHIPSFFYLQTVTGPGSLVGFLLGMLAGAIFLTWLYNSSGGSILIVAVWHALFDYVTACTECKSGMIAPIVSTLVMMWAVVIVFLYKSKNLSRRERHVQ